MTIILTTVRATFVEPQPDEYSRGDDLFQQFDAVVVGVVNLKIWWMSVTTKHKKHSSW